MLAVFSSHLCYYPTTHVVLISVLLYNCCMMSGQTPNQQQIVGFLKGRPDDQFYLRELARRLDLDPGNLSRELQTLVDSGILLKIHEGNLTYFSLRSAGEGEVGGRGFVDDPRVVNYLRRYKSDLVNLVRGFVRVPFPTRKNSKDQLDNRVFELSKKFGLFSRFARQDSHRATLVIDLEDNSDPRNPPFLLLGDLGTTPVVDVSRWRYHPYSGHTARGKVYGGGVLPKAGIACQLFTLRLIKDLGLDIPVAPRIVLSSGHPGRIVDGAVGAIYARGGRYELGIAQWGRLQLRVIISASDPEGALLALPEVLEALKNIEIPKSKHPLFAGGKNVLRILGVKSVGNGVELACEISYIPGMDITKVYDRTKALLQKIAAADDVVIEVEKGEHAAAFALSPEERIVQILSSACKSVYGDDVPAKGIEPVGESFRLVARRIPTVVFGPLGGNAGEANEFVQIDSLAKTVLVYLQTISSF